MSHNVSTGLHIGSCYYQLPDYPERHAHFNGTLDDLRIYDTTSLTSAQMNSLASTLANNGEPTVSSVEIWKFDETSGCTAHSLSGSHDGTLNNYSNASSAATWIDGKQGNAIHFNGVDIVGADDYVELNNVPLNNSSQGANTISFWMYRDYNLTFVPISFGGQYNLKYVLNSGFGFNDGSSNILGVNASDVPTGWVHIVAVFGNSNPTTNCKLYINGKSQNLLYKIGSSLSIQIPSSSTSIYLGHKSANTDSFKGSLDDLRIYNRVLTAEEAAVLAAQGQPEIDLTTLKGRAVNTDIPPHCPENAQTIDDLAKALNYSPIEMYEWVLNNIEYQPYCAMKGAQATLETRAGNDWDTASLAGEFVVESRHFHELCFGHNHSALQSVHRRWPRH